MKVRFVGIVLPAVLLAACNTGVGGATPGPSSGPALTMEVLREVPCPAGEGIAAVVCVQVHVTNHGDPGGGTCTLWADVTSSTGNDSIEGPELQVGHLGTDASMAGTLTWRSPLPSGYTFRGLCDPSLRS